MRVLYSIALQDSSLAYMGTAYGCSNPPSLKRVPNIVWSIPIHTRVLLLDSCFVSILGHRGVVILLFLFVTTSESVVRSSQVFGWLDFSQVVVGLRWCGEYTLNVKINRYDPWWIGHIRCRAHLFSFSQLCRIVDVSTPNPSYTHRVPRSSWHHDATRT